MLYDQLMMACEALKTNGFINYFGLQRFGAGAPTHLVGSALLKGDWSAASDLILSVQDGDDMKVQEAKRRFLEDRNIQVSNMEYDEFVES